MSVAGRLLLLLALVLSLGSFLPEEDYSPALPMPVVEERPAPQPYVVPLAYVETLIYYTDEQGVPVWLAARLFAWESGWNADYRGRLNQNGTRDYGLAALNSAYLKVFAAYNDGKPVDPFDAETAIRVGVRYLAALYAETGSWSGAAAAYNVGYGAWKAGARPVRHIEAVMGASLLRTGN